MAQTTALRAARKYGPGYFIREQMELREWTQEDLAEVIGVSIKHTNKILQDEQQLTLSMARVLGEVFNTSAQYWINIDTGYRLWQMQERSASEVEADIKGLIYEHMPIKDMCAKGWLKATKDANELKAQVLRFWGWKELDFAPLQNDYLPYLTKKSEAYNQFNVSYALTWYRKAQLVASTYKVGAYKRAKLEALYDKLHTYTTRKNGVNEFIKELNACGVIFFVLPHLQKTYLDGAAFFHEKNPVVVYTGRYKRIDNFWFTMAHEIAHVLYHLKGSHSFILDNLDEGDLSDIELEANEYAAEKLKHTEVLDYLEPHLGYLTSTKVEECAREYEVHPAIIIGKLAHEKVISYANQKRYNENVLESIQKQYRFI
ncbi:MAG: ImmA/IrrE family metallo-endopeptidase [Flavobacteriales bacterium]